jgi:hypothetical protein
MLGYIWDVINPKDYKNLYDLMQRCNELRENRGMDTGFMSTPATVQRSQSPARSDRRGSSPFRGKLNVRAKSSHRRFRTGPARGGKDSNNLSLYLTR